MRKLVPLILIIFTGILSANILIPGPYAEELMWIDGEWHLELDNRSVDPPTLNDCYIYNADNYSEFLDIDFPNYGVTLVTKDSLDYPFEFNIQSDEITLGWIYEEYYLPSSIIQYGEGYYSMIPLAGESLIFKCFVAWYGEVIGNLYCRDNSPTLGAPNDNEGFTGTFCGSVVNENSQPLAGAVIEYFPYHQTNEIITNMDGEFSLEMYTVRYDIQVKYEEVTYIDTMIAVAPDSIISIDFVLPIPQNSVSPSILKKSEISNYPNPFNPSTTIQFSLPIPMDDVKIEIFNNRGQKVRTLGFNLVSEALTQSITWDGRNDLSAPVSSGVYFARLKGDGILLKECKMLLLK